VPPRPSGSSGWRDVRATAQRVGTDELEIRLAVLDAEIKGLKDLLAEMRANRDDLRANRDELRADRDDWRGRAERLLTDQRPASFWRRLFG
jgi:hypothetical protein